MKSQFVIACTTDDQSYQFLALDRASGGYPYWCDYLKSAEFYQAVDDPKLVRELNEIINGKDRVFSDNSISPTRIVHMALDLNNDKLKGEGKVLIMEIKPPVIVREFPIKGEIKLR